MIPLLFLQLSLLMVSGYIFQDIVFGKTWSEENLFWVLILFLPLWIFLLKRIKPDVSNERKQGDIIMFSIIAIVLGVLFIFNVSFSLIFWGGIIIFSLLGYISYRYFFLGAYMLVLLSLLRWIFLGNTPYMFQFFLWSFHLFLAGTAISLVEPYLKSWKETLLKKSRPVSWWTQYTEELRNYADIYFLYFPWVFVLFLIEQELPARDYIDLELSPWSFLLLVGGFYYAITHIHLQKLTKNASSFEEWIFGMLTLIILYLTFPLTISFPLALLSILGYVILQRYQKYFNEFAKKLFSV